MARTDELRAAGKINPASHWIQHIHGDRAFYHRLRSRDNPSEQSLEMPAEGVWEVHGMGARDFATSFARAEASSPEALASVLPLVRELFAMFDADGDGKLSKAEYEAYLRGIGAWGSGSYTDEEWDERWPEECKQMESGTDGISREGFESILYGKYRAGKAQADLDACKQARAD